MRLPCLQMPDDDVGLLNNAAKRVHDIAGLNFTANDFR